MFSAVKATSVVSTSRLPLAASRLQRLSIPAFSSSRLMVAASRSTISAFSTSQLYYTPLAASRLQRLSIPAFSSSRLMVAASRSTISAFSTSQLYHTSLAPKEKLFNRAKEVEFVSNLLKTNQPQLSLITGPVNSGKSMLLRHVLNELSKGSVVPKILPLNMRELPFLDVESFIECLSKELSAWYEELLSSCQVNSKYFKVEWKSRPPTLINLLKAMSKELRDWTWLQGYQIPTPILFIDEANKLRELVKIDPKGQKALETVFTWFVAMTKEQCKFHVILCSSDSFMFNWLANFVGNDRFKVYPIGHLSKEEAKRFWEKRVSVDGFHNQEKLSFEEVFNVAGGNMFLMKMMYIDYQLAGVHPEDSIYLQMAKSRLLKALRPNNTFINDPLKSPPKWTAEDILTTIEKISNSDGGYVYIDELDGELTEGSLDSLIEYNVVYLRPYFKMSYQDLDPVPTRATEIITAESQVSLLAMRRLIDDLATNKSQL